ncbi:hypothetical protein FIBSPDRAFT_960175 [Athelia psychrophila]|uniref:Uncharacterized protein n=1 Tax=Athelia psychrophila TaxID=1759441 RepID=A0A166CPW3_9AGAM|nr:hypothetical protein FIBSPDRAFT_960175 [Fibularhizoctonia sp. CBS 109695]
MPGCEIEVESMSRPLRRSIAYGESDMKQTRLVVSSTTSLIFAEFHEVCDASHRTKYLFTFTLISSHRPIDFHLIHFWLAAQGVNGALGVNYPTLF